MAAGRLRSTLGLGGGFVLVVMLLAGCEPLLVAPPSPPLEGLVVVPAGFFLMGQDDGPASSRPQRLVYLDAFAIERTEVTNAAFARFVQATGYLAAGWDPTVLPALADVPAVGVTWRDADAYCRWAGLRLPTEAQWEKAARGTDGRTYPWGDTWDPARANTAESGLERPLPSGGIEWIDLNYPPAGVSIFGIRTHWLVWFILFSMASAFLLKGKFGVTV